MDLYTQFMAWVNYAKAELTLAEIEEDKCANDLKVKEAFGLIAQWSTEAKGDRVTLAKARRDTDPDVIASTEAHLTAKAYRKLVDSMFDRCERGAQLISRELSRRISLSPKDRASHRYAP